MSESISKQLNLPPMDQVGFVYQDIDAAIALYEPMFGPFELQDYGEFEYNYRGQQEAARLRIAFGKSGDIEIELIGWISGGCPHKEFLDAGREGIHHLRFRVDDVDYMVSEAERFGWSTIWYNRFGEGLVVAYMERADDPLLIEFFENRNG